MATGAMRLRVIGRHQPLAPEALAAVVAALYPYPAPNGSRQEEPMRAQFLAFTILATMASGAFAQQAAPPTNTFMNNKDVMALGLTRKGNRKAETPLVAEPILALAPYRAMLEYRPGISPAAV